jgi:multiple sugar transport system ATP-binding protein
MAEVVLRNIKKSFGPVDIIKGVDIDINDKEFVVLVGPSGCGKTTTLRMIAGLESISSGELRMAGKRVNEVSPARAGRRHGVPVLRALSAHDGAREHGLRPATAKVPEPEIRKRVDTAAQSLGLTELLDRRPKEMSGGQRQRVAMGRAIVRQAGIFLFDEPLSNLDAKLRGQMRIEVSRLHRAQGATSIYVTHDQVEAMTLADKIVVLQGGVVEQVGSPLELYHHPANRFVAGFIGSPTMNFIDATVKAVAPEGVTVELPGGDNLTVLVAPGATKVGDKLTLGVRPEHLQEGSGDGKLTGTALVVERLGGATYAYVKLDNGTMITAEVDGNSHIRVNDPIQLGVRSQTCHLFGSDGLALAQSTRHPLADVGRGKGGH